METRRAKFTFKTKELPFIPVYYSSCMYKWVEEKGEVIKKVKKIESTEHFIELSKKIFGDYAFDYSFCKFYRTSTPVMLKCNKCGEYFKVFPLQHLNGKIGCPECSELRETIDNSDRLNYFHQYVKNKYYGLFSVPRNRNPKEKLYIKCNTCGNIFRTTAEDIRSNLVCPKCGINFYEDILKPDILERKRKRKLEEEELERKWKLEKEELDRKNKEDIDYLNKKGLTISFTVFSKELDKVRKSSSKLEERKKEADIDINDIIFNRPGFYNEYVNLRDKLNKILQSYKRSLRSINILEKYPWSYLIREEDRSSIEQGINYIYSYIRIIDDKLQYYSE